MPLRRLSSVHEGMYLLDEKRTGGRVDQEHVEVSPLHIRQELF
jgi:hypothetical protein